MKKKFEIVLTENNWNKLTAILSLFPHDNFLKFCFINYIIERGVAIIKEEIKEMDFLLKEHTNAL